MNPTISSPSTGVATPGPWMIFPGNYRAAFVVPVSHAKRKLGAAADAIEDRTQFAQEICAIEFHHRHRSADEQLANAHLIASAPDLRDALRDVLKFVAYARGKVDPGFFQIGIDKAYDALKKAPL